QKLDLTPFAVPGSPAAAGPREAYRLVGAILHIGDVGFGHYYAITDIARSTGDGKRHSPQWTLFDDSKVSTLDDVSKARLDTLGYLFFYVRDNAAAAATRPFGLSARV